MKTRKCFVHFILFICMCFILIPSFVMPVYADYTCKVCNKEHECNGVEKLIIEITEGAATLDFLKEDEGTNLSLVEILKFDTSGNKVFNALWNGSGGTTSVKSVVDGLIPAGVIIATVFFLLEVGERVFTANYTAEQLALSFVRYGLVLLIATNVFTIITLVNQLATLVFDLLYKQAQTNAVKGVCCYNIVADLNVFELVGHVLGVLFNYVIVLLCRILITMTAWKRAFEIIVYSMFAPVGIADIVRGGLDSSGVRYLKKVGAKFLQGGVCLAIIIGYNIIVPVILKNPSGSSGIITLILALSVTTLMFQADSISSSIVGV